MRIAKRRNEAQHGVTLLELIIAISLVAIISAGMLTAMRTSLMTNDKVASRLEANRARVNVRQMIARQLGGAMPVTTYCNGAQVGLFDGAAQRLRFVSSFSIVEGSHGYPQIVEYSIAPSTDGGFRLLATEAPYTGPSSATSFCGGEPPATSETQPVVVADHLARCDFLYQQLIQPLPFSDAQWIPQWTQPQLPIAVKIELAPLERAPELIPSLDIVVGLHPDRDFRGFFADR